MPPLSQGHQKQQEANQEAEQSKTHSKTPNEKGSGEMARSQQGEKRCQYKSRKCTLQNVTQNDCANHNAVHLRKLVQMRGVMRCRSPGEMMEKLLGEIKRHHTHSTLPSPRGASPSVIANPFPEVVMSKLWMLCTKTTHLSFRMSDHFGREWIG